MKVLSRRTRWFLALVIVCLLVALLTCAFSARAKSIFSVVLALLLLVDLLEPIGWLVHAIVRGPSIGEEPSGRPGRHVVTSHRPEAPTGRRRIRHDVRPQTRVSTDIDAPCCP